MSIASINSNVAAYSAQAAIQVANDQVTSSVSRLATGNAIIQASDNVAGLSIGEGLLTQVSTLKTAQQNASLGTSLLQVADGALAQIQNILQQQASLAAQANSGSLSNTQRGFLDQQFQALTSQINNIVAQTNFNGVTLLDGSLSTGATLSNSTTQASAGSATITLTQNPSNAQTFIIGGVTLTAKNAPTAGTTDFQIGATAADTAANLAAKLNALAGTYDSNNYQNSLGQATYSSSGNSLIITSRTGGALGNSFTINTTGTATAVNSQTSGSFGGTSVTVFSTGFSSSTASLTAGGANATPFAANDTITATIAGTSKTLYTIAAGDSLSNIVNGINANAAATGVSANLTYDASAQKYNMTLNYGSTTSPMVLSLGGNYYASANNVNATQNTSVSTTDFIAQQGSYVFGAQDLKLFHANLTTAHITGASTAVGTSTFASISASTPFFAGDTLTATMYAPASPPTTAVGSTVTLATYAATDTLASLITKINANTATTGIYAVGTGTAGGSNFNVQLYYGNPTDTELASAGANTDASAASATLAQVDADTTSTQSGGSGFIRAQQDYGLNGGQNNGLGLGSTSVTGTVGDSAVTALAQTAANYSINFQNVAVSDLTGSSAFNTSTGNVYLTVGGHNFGFTTTAASGKASDEITVGATLQDTLDNAVSTINNYLASGHATGDTAYQLNQIKVARSGNTLVFTGNGISDVKAIGGGAATAIAITNYGGTTTTTGSSTLANSTRHATSTAYGVDVTGVSNANFTGTVTGFNASYVSPNTVNLSVAVGGYTYTASNVNTNPTTANQTIRFYSNTAANGSNGGYFDVQLAQNQGQAVNGQTDATTYASHINAAFQTLSFNQEHQISSYSGTQSIVVNGSQIGSLVGSKVSAQLSDFSGDKLSNVSVTAPTLSGGDAVLALTINGETFQSATGLGSQLGANQTFRLTSTTNPSDFVDFTTGNSTIDLSTAANATAVQSALATAFGANSGSAALSFQVGTSATATIGVSLANSSTSSIFGGATPDVLTQADASNAATIVNDAINTITATRATVGALESQFNFTSANLSTAIQNQDSARSNLLDTNVASESTNFATEQVKLQAGIAVLAQANQQQQNLLKLIA